MVRNGRRRNQPAKGNQRWGRHTETKKFQETRRNPHLEHIERECVKIKKRKVAACFPAKSNLLTEINPEAEQREERNSHLVCVPRILRHGCRLVLLLLLAATLHDTVTAPQEPPKEQKRTEHKAAKRKERFDRSHSAPNLASTPLCKAETQVASLKKEINWRGEKVGAR